MLDVKIAIYSALVLLLAPLSTFGQNPEILDQTNSGTGGGTVIWSSNEQWIATLNAQAGEVRIYDLKSRRFSRSIAVPGGVQTQAFALPGQDRLAVNSGGIAVYDVLSGERVFTLPNAEGCTIRSVEGGHITADCMGLTKSALRPYAMNMKTWDAADGKQLSEEPREGQAPMARIFDGGWVGETKTGSVGKMIGKQMLSALRQKNGAPNPYTMMRFTITDSANQQKIYEGTGLLVAISKKGQSAVINGSGGLTLIRIPSGQQIRRLGGGPEKISEGYYTATGIPGQSEYLVSNLTESAMIDASTGDVKARLPDLRAGGVVSPSATRIALSQGNGILLVSLPDVSQREVIGNEAPELTAAISAQTKAAYRESLQQLEANASPSGKEMKQRGKQMMKEEREFEKTLPKFNMGKRAQMEEEHRREQREKQQQSAQLNTGSGYDSAAMKDYAAATFQSYTVFGAPAMIPPEVDFLNSGRIFAVLAADFSWSVWDVATGNLLPSRRNPLNYHRLLELTSQHGRESENREAVYQYLRDQLTSSYPGLKVPVDKPVPPKADHQAACRSQSGGYVMDVQVELDPKKWKSNTHRLTSAVLRSSDGSTVDLLAKQIDLSAMAQVSQISEMASGSDKSRCGISDDGKYLVVEQLKPDVAKQKHLSWRERAMEQAMGKTSSDSLVVYEMSTGKLDCELEDSHNIDAVAGDAIFSSGSRYLAMGKGQPDPLQPMRRSLAHKLRVWDVKSCKKLVESPGTAGEIVGFSPDESTLYVGTEALATGQSISYGIQAIDVKTGAKGPVFADAAADTHLMNTSANGRIFFDADRANALGFWDAKTGERLASMRALQEGEWLITTPAGYFDGSPRGWTQIAWRVPGQGLATQPGEIFFNEFYRPGLLSELLGGKVPSTPRNIQDVDRRQPTIHISARPGDDSGRNFAVTIEVEEASADAVRKQPSGVRDVRLFRNGTLVKAWRGDAQLRGGKAVFETTVPAAGGKNQFVAYAFNRDNIKSTDAAVSVESKAAKRAGTAYILTVGVNRYANEEFNLKYAVPDAQTLGDRFLESHRRMGSQQKLVQVQLLDGEATKANILAALSLLAGKRIDGSSPSVPKQLNDLQPAQPEDSVLVYFAGHGTAWGDRFYLIPHDLGYSGARSDLPGSLQTVLQNSISDQDLEAAFEPIQADHSMLIIDACNSGKALDSEEQRRGPMNSRGLAQLAYEKGMYVLTAAQGYQAAIESSRLGHGYLTYALAEEGLRTSVADEQPVDGRITAAEWFEYASRRVPELQMEAMRSAEESGRSLTFDAAVPATGGSKGVLQTPRFYYRRDLKGTDAIVAAFTQ